jgi:hypothetical protein
MLWFITSRTYFNLRVGFSRLDVDDESEDDFLGDFEFGIIKNSQNRKISLI